MDFLNHWKATGCKPLCLFSSFYHVPPKNCILLSIVFVIHFIIVLRIASSLSFLFFFLPNYCDHCFAFFFFVFIRIYWTDCTNLSNVYTENQWDKISFIRCNTSDQHTLHSPFNDIDARETYVLGKTKIFFCWAICFGFLFVFSTLRLSCDSFLMLNSARVYVSFGIFRWWIRKVMLVFYVEKHNTCTYRTCQNENTYAQIKACQRTTSLRVSESKQSENYWLSFVILLHGNKLQSGVFLLLLLCESIN